MTTGEYFMSFVGILLVLYIFCTYKVFKSATKMIDNVIKGETK